MTIVRNTEKFLQFMLNNINIRFKLVSALKNPKKHEINHCYSDRKK